MNPRSYYFLIFFLVLASCVGGAPSDADSPAADVSLLPPTATLDGLAHTEAPIFPPLSKARAEQLLDSWSTFRDEDIGIAFQYAALYDEPGYQVCAPKVFQEGNSIGIQIGERIWIGLRPSDVLDLNSHVQSFLSRVEGKPDSLIMLKERTTLGGVDAYYIQYRLGSTDRYEEVTIAVHDQQLVTIDFIAGAMCSFRELDISETQTLDRIRESFQFIEP